MSKEDLRLVVITGLSGAGKTQTMQSLEDNGYFCVDNLPPAFIVKFAEICAQGKVPKAAIVCDSRGGTFFKSLSEALANLEAEGFRYDMLFLEASDEALVYRYKESRRRHPSSKSGGVLDAIQAERRQLEYLRGQAHKVIDTTGLSASQLREQIAELFCQENKIGQMTISVISFGYKYGIPLDSDLVFDVRFLPNPYYVSELRPLTGQEDLVRNYIFNNQVSQEFVKRFIALIEYILPYYLKEGKTHLVISVGCTGGQHRSVAISEHLGKFLDKNEYSFSIKHRDMARNLKGVEGLD